MRRVAKILGWMLGLLLAVPAALVVAVWIGANTGAGRRQIERLAPRLTGDAVRLAGIGGRFPEALRIARIEVRDAKGTYVTVTGVALDWSPLALLRGLVDVDVLSAHRVDFARLPVPSNSPPSTFSMPVRVTVRSVRVDELDMAAPVIGTEARLAVQGSARIDTLRGLPDLSPQDDASLTLSIAARDGSGRYGVEAALAPARNHALLTVQEQPGGLIARLASLPALGAIEARIAADGPRERLDLSLALTAGGLRANAGGTLDAVHGAADLTVKASAPAMAPAADLSWQSGAVDMLVQGKLTAPHARGTVAVAGLAAGGAGVRSITAAVDGDQGSVSLRGTLEGVRLPGPKPDLLAAAPVRVEADARLDAPDRPVRFAVRHPLLALDGTARTAGAVQADATAALPDLAPLAALGGLDLQGRAALTLHAAEADGATTAQLDGTLGMIGGQAPIPGLLGENATLGLTATLRGRDVTVSRLSLAGRAVTVSGTGALAGGALGTLRADAEASLSDLSMVAPQLGGEMAAKLHAAGPLEDLAAHADLTGRVAAKGMDSGPFTASLDATGLPGKPQATLAAQGSLLGAPLDLAASARRQDDGTLALDIQRAKWKSVEAGGAATLPRGATIPQGSLHLAVARLDDLAPLVGQKLAGSLTAALEADARRARLTLEAQDAGAPGSATAGRATLNATVDDPAGHPSVDAALAIEGLAAAADIRGSARATVRGPADALSVKLDANLPVLAGSPATLAAAATIDAAGRSAALSAFQAGWHGETVRLLDPARIGFRDGITVDRLRLGLRQAVLEASGRAAPTLDLTASVRNLPADLAAVFDPSLAADGTLRADARLAGPTRSPSGTVSLAANGIRLRQGPGRALPPASLDAKATLGQGAATVNATATAGTTRLTVTGRAPIGQGPLDLRAGGAMDLAMLDPLIAAQGRRVRGRITLDATVGGTLARPALAGTVRLAGGEVQDFALGAHLTSIEAVLRGAGDTMRIERLNAAAGPGTITASGSVGVLAPGIPVDLAVTARNARPLSSDLLTATADADLSVRGAAAAAPGQGGLAVNGKVTIKRADIRIPERLPVSVPVLNVLIPGAAPPPPPAPPPPIALDLTLDAPEEIFVRGRGLDAELGGRVHMGGTLADLRPSGGFEMRRGIFSLAGQTLTFTKGTVGFIGAGIADPAIDFVATASNGGILATLEVTGTASAPKIVLSSVPELPQDEVLAHLLFGRSASSLSPFELAQIAAALASLTGVAPGAADPLGGVRQALGLDRLSVGSGANGAPALEAGRYVARGVYVGVKQGVSGADTQAQVQVDLTRGLKLQGTVGTGHGAAAGSTTVDPNSDSGSSLGLTYQFEY